MCALLYVCECNGCDLDLFVIHCVVLYDVFVTCECDCAKPPSLNLCLCVCGLCVCVWLLRCDCVLCSWFVV